MSDSEPVLRPDFSGCYKKFSPVVLVVLAVGVFSLFHGLFLADQPVVWADNFDSYLIYWTLAWGHHALAEAGKVLSFFNANSFYPHGLTLAYSDSLLTAQVFNIPLRLLGLNQLQAMYGTLIATVGAGVLLTDWSLRRLSFFSAAERLFLVYYCHFCLCLTNGLAHYQLFGFHLAPSFLILAYSFVRYTDRSALIALCAVYSFAIGYSIYLAPMLVAVSVLSLAPLVIRRLAELGILRFLFDFGLKSVGFVIPFGLFCYFVLLKPYFTLQSEFPAQDLTQTAQYSAAWNSLFTEVSKHSLWYGHLSNYSYGDWEYAYFPGYFMLAGLLLGSLCILAGRRRGKQESEAQSERGIFQRYCLWLFICLWILSLGPYVLESVKAPYYYLTQFMPGLRSLRAPGRFGMLMGLPLGVIALTFLSQLGKPSTAGVVRRGLAASMACLILAETVPGHDVYPFEAVDPKLYAEVGQRVDDSTVMVELPVIGKDHFATIRGVMQQLQASQYHWAKLMVGYGGKTSPEMTRLIYIDSLFGAGNHDGEEFLGFANFHKVDVLLVHLDRYAPARREALERYLRTHAHKVESLDSGRVLFVRLRGV